MRHLASLDGLGDSSDLVNLQEETRAGLLLDTSLNTGGVGDEQVVSNNLAASDLGEELGVVSPVILVERILDGDNGEVLGETLVNLDELVSGDNHGGVSVGVLEVKVVLAILVELRGGDVHADLDLAGVSSLLDGLDQEVQALLVLLDIGGETTLVTNVAGIHAVLLLDHTLEGVVHLGGHADSLLERLGTGGTDHELLHGKPVAGVGTAVDDVHPGHGHHVLLDASNVSEMLVERHALGSGTSLGSGHGNGQDGVGSEVVLVGAAVQVGHLLVDGRLVSGVHALEGRSDPLINILASLLHSLSEVPPLVSVTELAGLIDSSRST
mmetsp:Transcript_22761/g.35650  ORF Transcript_22761/g.35650 Transcript_22761/m.35650 type:complete len:325 (-) Transcript_22761:275-1249(-)